MKQRDHRAADIIQSIWSSRHPVGICLAQSDTIDLIIQRVRMPYNISALTQAVARVALRNIDQIQFHNSNR
jgi:hypothetical protein